VPDTPSAEAAAPARRARRPKPILSLDDFEPAAFVIEKGKPLASPAP
jgi:hypothetical protein